MIHRLLIVGAFILILAVPLNGFADQVAPGYNLGLGPLQTRSQAIGQTLRLTMPPIDPGKFQSDGYLLSVSTTWTNVWADEDRYFLDYEVLDSRVELSKALTKKFALSAGFCQRDYFGGNMDNAIQEFHDWFGIDQNGRDDFPRNESRIILYDKAGNAVSVIEDVTHANNNAIYVAGQYLLHPRYHPMAGHLYQWDPAVRIEHAL